jgi:alkanesulfonate monooxygenase SsuD/methylene tetrahydromethanopterin reductase-like flavin-dependent oxidoreductase (luciferase family)
MPIYAAPTQKEAVEEPYENFTYFFQRHAELTRSGLGRADTGPTDRRQAKLEQLTQLTYENILETRAAVGTAGALVERLGALRDDLGLTGLVAELNPGGLLSLERMQRTLRILTHEVIPALR